jgi:hypothetical protein
MSIRLQKPWQDLTPDAVRRLPGQLGVYELSDAQGRVLYIGYAGGRSRFGLRSELERALAEHAEAARFRYEVNMQYLSRWEELLMLHVADHGGLPRGNATHAPRRLGRLSPL